MDGERFDNLARGLASVRSRRAVLRGVVAALVGGTAAASRVPAGHGSVSAAPIRCEPHDPNAPGPPKRCGQCGLCQPNGDCTPFNSQCPGTAGDHSCATCDPVTFTCSPPKRCGPCESCVDNRQPGCSYIASGPNGQCDPDASPCNAVTGRCACPRNQTLCGGRCVDTRTDRENCGGCGVACSGCQTCRFGVCVDDCAACEVCRDGGCESTCGLCDDCNTASGRCEDNHRCVPCVDGTGGPTAAAKGGAVAEVRCGPCETCDPTSPTGCSPLACASCERCDPTTGACVPGCGPCEACQGDTCVSTCGACETCQDGACAGSCAAGETCCGGACVGTGCPEGQTLDPATCSCACPGGTVECAGACVDTATDPANCGGCGVSCRADQVCEGGACACATGTDCGGACVDTAADPANCGGCGVACAAGETCEAGACVPVCLPVSCPSGQSQNPETCACECTGFQDGCAPHEVCENGACRAVCADTSGGGVHNGTFVACPGPDGAFAGCSCNTCGTTCRHSQGYACCSDGCQYVVTTCAGMGH